MIEDDHAANVRYLIGVDDTDDSKAPGTDALVRRLAEWLQADRLAVPHGITSHQLYAHKPVSYTRHNTCVCLALEAENVEAVWETARDFLALEAVEKASAGLALSRWDGVSREVVELSKRAKGQAVTLEEAQQAAARSRLRVAPVHGDGRGVVGAVAAIGLRRAGNDGRYSWLPGAAELHGKHSVNEILGSTRIEHICSVDGREPPISAVVDVGDSARPVLRDGRATLLVEEKKHGWSALDKEQLKELVH
jgi:hypothetical protein